MMNYRDRTLIKPFFKRFHGLRSDGLTVKPLDLRLFRFNCKGNKDFGLLFVDKEKWMGDIIIYLLLSC